MMDRIERIRQSFVTRKTDPSDTHDAIQRHDPDFHKHKGHQNRNDWEDHEDDLTDISIESLMIFLEGLKKESDNDGANAPDTKPVHQTMQPAINAYASQDKIDKRHTYLDSQSQKIDRDLINALLDDLREFHNNGYEHISLVRADSFLDAIARTIQAVKAHSTASE